MRLRPGTCASFEHGSHPSGFFGEKQTEPCEKPEKDAVVPFWNPILVLKQAKFVIVL
jgi:hypothetical protein